MPTTDPTPTTDRAGHVCSTAELGWRAMVYAPRDGSSVELLIEHRTWWTAHKCSPDKASMWRAICPGQWIDHNGGGWTWAGMSGAPIGWRPLETPNL